jgi:hypothetical protein
MPLQRISSRRSHYENRNAYDFDCKSHLDTDLDGIQIQSNTEQNYDGETGFINQRFIENDSRRKVMSTICNNNLKIDITKYDITTELETAMYRSIDLQNINNTSDGLLNG